MASLLILGGALALAPTLVAEDTAADNARPPSEDPENQEPAGLEQNRHGQGEEEASEEETLGEEEEKNEEGKEDEEDTAEEESPDNAPDALRDPVLEKLLTGIVLIDRPGFGAETHRKIQIQHLDADADDPLLEDDLFLRRLRPFFFGHIGKSWTWKLEAEISSRIEAGTSDLDQLNLRDVYVASSSSTSGDGLPRDVSGRWPCRRPARARPVST